MKTLILSFLKAYYGILSAILPNLAAKKAFMLFQKTKKMKLKPKEEKLYDKARHFQIPTSNLDEDVHCYHLKNEEVPPNGKTAVLVHGWDSNAGSLMGIAEKLLSEGFEIYALDLPAHGKSKLIHCNLYISSLALKALLEFVADPKQTIYLISHSFGSAVVGYALWKTDAHVDKVVMLTTPNKMTTIFREFQQFIGLGEKSYQKMLDITKNIIGEPLENVEVAKKLALANIPQLSIIHDKFDKVVPFQNAKDVVSAIPNAKLITYEKIGHYRMLWNEEVINQVAAILSNKQKELKIEKSEVQQKVKIA
ncbi:alpha/beta hydrolase [Flammeovirgaceae bacterium SG7u.111]|nr:alpha/beta hydrolase [Flammeovirgaceae bacterium SG7u.132]WPO34404.1 alpha/beta hydrolase [Flammeovirgaceae bacterium SG7u.111]